MFAHASGNRLQFFRSTFVRGVLMAVLVVVCIVWIQDFKVFDRDFWWHITAGNLMLHTGHFIHTDPFAYTRAGLPYLATHEWLAQIVMAGVMNIGGIDGIIVFRTLMCILTFGLLLAIAPRRIWPFGFLAIWAANIVRGGFLERPQFFTFVIFAAMILLAFRFLESGDSRKKLWICGAFGILELLWVNMHGGAALLGIALMGFLFLQRAVDAVTGTDLEGAKKDALLLFGTGIVLGVIFILPPNGFESIQYVWDLLHDKTIAYIAEWQPRAWPLYLLEMGPFWLAAVLLLIWQKRQWVFCALLLLATGYLSRQAFRHETLFVMASIAIVFFQLDTAGALWTSVKKNSFAMGIITALALAILVPAIHLRGTAFMRHDNLFGYGAFDLAKGATDFVEKEHIGGNMFNTYGIGGYLIYRGLPVFIDGRNVDYGFDFMSRTYAAGIDADRWKDLEDTYHLNYALIDYDAIRLEDHIPYSQHLDTNPNWKMVYIDDWVAVYVKNSPENAELIRRSAYTYLSPTALQFHSDFSTVPAIELPTLEAELGRAIAASPESIKARMVLANLLLKTGSADQAFDLVQDALAVRPRSPEPYVVLASIAIAKGDWQSAAALYRQVISLAGDEYKNMNYSFLAAVFDKAGDHWTALTYARMAGTGSLVAPTSSTPSGTGGVMVNPAQDAIDFNDQGIALAEGGKPDEARTAFLTSLKINPSFAEAWNNLCALDITLEKFDDALTECNRAISVNKIYGDAYFNLSLVYLHTDKVSEATTAQKQAKKYGRDTASLESFIRLRASQK